MWGTIGSGVTPGSRQDGQNPEIPENSGNIPEKPDFHVPMFRGHELSYRIPCTISPAICGVPWGLSRFATGSYLNFGPLRTMVYIWTWCRLAYGNCSWLNRVPIDFCTMSHFEFGPLSMHLYYIAIKPCGRRPLPGKYFTRKKVHLFCEHDSFLAIYLKATV